MKKNNKPIKAVHIFILLIILIIIYFILRETFLNNVDSIVINYNDGSMKYIFGTN